MRGKNKKIELSLFTINSILHNIQTKILKNLLCWDRLIFAIGLTNTYLYSHNRGINYPL